MTARAPIPPPPAAWVQRIERAWERHGTALLAVAAVHAAMTTILRLRAAFDAAEVVTDEAGQIYGPIDLMYRYEEVHRWFAGQQVYGALENADYPPAAYAVLWPLLSGTPASAETAFLLTAVLSLAMIGAVAMYQSNARNLAGKSFMALFIAAASATQLTIWIGQVGLHIVALLLVAASLLCGRAGHTTTSWARDIVLAFLVVAALVKPTVAVPIVLALVIIGGRWRPALLIAALYGGLTLMAAAFQEPSLLTLIGQWLVQDGQVMFEEGSANLNLWLWWLGLGAWKLQASFVVLVATAAWLWRYRHADPWALVGVSALVARLWIHHRSHDDVMLVIAAVALFRLARSPLAGGATGRVAAGLALAALYAVGQMPMSWITVHASTEAWATAETVRTLALLSALAVLAWHVRHADARDTLPLRSEPSAAIPPPGRFR